MRVVRSCLPPVLALLFALAPGTAAGAAQEPAPRPMTFMDILRLRSAGEPAVSPDNRWLLYTLTVPNWKAAKSYTDLYLVSLEKGLETTRQLTSTRDRNETSPAWSRDGRFFVFLSDRDAPPGSAAKQLYLMRPDGGEARRLTEGKEGVQSFAFSRDGRWLAFSAGKAGERQVWGIPVETIEQARLEQLTKHAAGVDSWQFSPDSRRIYFLAPEEDDRTNRERKEKQFTVRVRNEDSPLDHLWALDLDSRAEQRLTSSPDYSVSDVVVSRDSRWIGFRGTPADRYARSIVESRNHADLYLLSVPTGQIERLTQNTVGESRLSFSPDSSLLAFSAPDGFAYFRNDRVYARPVSGGEWKKLGSGFDGDAGIGFWSRDGRTVHFSEGERATLQCFALCTREGTVTPVTRERGVLRVTEDDETGRILITYSDPTTPPCLWTVPSPDQIGDRRAWIRLTDPNPEVATLALGRTETIEWKSADGRRIEGVLVKPVGYEPGKRYPLIVQIHGGPASASLLAFSGNSSDYSQVYAGAGYACFLPNYRGSSNYGERHKMEISGDYFRRGYEDIMTGVDHLIRIGLVDPDRMGVMGWSAGGHWSNWILTHTDRFKAISTGAGAVNWISMYAQTDVQRIREFYFKGAPYARFEHYWDVSPLKYIRNAKTPTLIHVVDGDPRVPRAQSEELHMALKKLGVPTEFLVYPGSTHGITEPRNRLVKMVAEFNWFEKWIRGKPGWFEWKELLETLDQE